MKKIPKKTGFILQILRKILIYYKAIDENEYMREWIKTKEVAFAQWLIYVILNGILWTTIFIVPIIAFGYARWIPVLIVSTGIARYIAKEVYEEKINIQRKRGI